MDLISNPRFVQISCLENFKNSEFGFVQFHPNLNTSQNRIIWNAIPKHVIWNKKTKRTLQLLLPDPLCCSLLFSPAFTLLLAPAILPSPKVQFSLSPPLSLPLPLAPSRSLSASLSLPLSPPLSLFLSPSLYLSFSLSLLPVLDYIVINLLLNLIFICIYVRVIDFSALIFVIRV